MNRFTVGLVALVFAATFGIGMIACKPKPISSVRADKPIYRPGETIVVSFTASPDYDPKAWIGLIPSKTPHGSEQANDDADVAYQYLENREQGTITFTAPEITGKWDLRMTTSDSNTGEEVAHTTFSVEGKPVKPATPPAPPPASPVAAPAPATPPTVIIVNEQPPAAAQPAARVVDQPVVATTPAAPVSVVPNTIASISISGSEYAPGAQISVTFTAPASFASDAWIGLIPSSIPHGSESTNDENDLAYQYLSKKTSGTLIFTAPNEPGEYDLRMNDSDANGKEVASVSFTVK